MADYTGYQKIIGQHPAHFWPFFKGQAEKLMPNSQISFINWLSYAHSELYLFVPN